MTTRSLIKFGKNSFAVTLPQNWIKKQGLIKGDSLFFEENNRGLVISSDNKTNKKQIKKIDIDVTEKDISRIRREIIANYINGYDVIRLKGEDIDKKSKDIRSVVHTLVALEVLEQTSKQIIARIFLLSQTTFIPQLIRKIEILNRNMMEDLGLKDANYDDILQRDQDIDRLTFLILRLIKSNLQDTSANRENNLSNLKLLDYWNVAYLLESIADEVRKLSVALKETSKDKKIFKDIIELYTSLVNCYKDTMDAYHSNNVEKAYSLSILKKDIADNCDKLYQKYWHKKGAVIALERIRDTAFLIHNIGRRTYS